MLVAIVPFFTMAQKRSTKNKAAKSQTSVENFMVIKGVEFSTDLETEGMMQQDMMDMMDSGEFHQSNKIRIFFDFGIRPSKEANKLIEKSRSIYSMPDAVNLLSEKGGWEFISANIETNGSVTVYYYYMRKK